MFQRFLICALVLILLNCSAGPPIRKGSQPTAQTSYEEGVYYKNQKNWELAIEKLDTVRHRFPLSPYAKKAELEIADIHFIRKNYIDARLTYELYKQFHPTDPHLDFVQYRIGLAYFYEIPSAIDRDTTPLYDTIDAFNVLKTHFPKSKHITDAHNKIQVCRGKLAQRSLYVASYYYRTKAYKSALGRGLEVLKVYRDTGHNEEAYFYIISSYDKLNQKENARKYFEKLKKEFPNSTYISKINL
ncbi:MAG: outer membrane protein assembly factor BamD [Deltaproteobacteria bacterium]|nr:outer membrane protein assembly factor BamD [Deltaproteobacteria bacterium]